MSVVRNWWWRPWLHFPFKDTCQRGRRTNGLPSDCSDHDIALWFTVIAHTLQAIHLGQVMDDPAMVSVHGREAVALLTILSLYWGKRWRIDKIILKSEYTYKGPSHHTKTAGLTKRWLSFRAQGILLAAKQAKEFGRMRSDALPLSILWVTTAAAGRD